MGVDLNRNGLASRSNPERRKEHQRPDHPEHHQQGGGEEDRLKSEHVVGRTVDPRLRLRGPDSFYPLWSCGGGREASPPAGDETGGDRALTAHEPGGYTRREALDLRRPAQDQLRSARASQLRGEHAVEGGAELEGLLLAATRETAAPVPDDVLLPRLEHVLLDGGERSRVWRKDRVVA